MREDTKQLIVLTIGLTLFFVLVITGMAYGGTINNETKQICLQTGNAPEECGL